MLISLVGKVVQKQAFFSEVRSSQHVVDWLHKAMVCVLHAHLDCGKRERSQRQSAHEEDNQTEAKHLKTAVSSYDLALGSKRYHRDIRCAC
jgi:hypothetical protein